MRKMEKLAKKGQKFSPVTIAGRKISTTFWGRAWCDNLESYSDFSNRLPRGRTYIRNGSVLDLRIEAGKVTSIVCGSELYRIEIKIKPLNGSSWKAIRTKCGQRIGSLVELLQGKLSNDVMAVVTERSSGLFPSPHEIDMSCSCPDWAGMCKHVAATLYGVGNRLDFQPELLFTLRQVDQMELIAQADKPIIIPAPGKRKFIAAADLTDVFGIEFDESLAPERVRTPAKSDHKGERFSEAHKQASRGALDQSHTARQTRQGPLQELRKNLRTSPRLPSG
jgi:uncharacterized Zn finger protein